MPAARGVPHQPRHEGRVALQGADERAGPRQVSDRGQRRHQHVLPLGRDHRRDAQQRAPGRRTEGPDGVVDARSGDVDQPRRQGVRRDQPVPGPVAGGQHRSGIRQRHPLGVPRLPRAAVPQRHVHQHHVAEPVAVPGQQVGDRGGHQAVEQHDGVIGDPLEAPLQPGARGRVGPRPVTGDRPLVDRPGTVAQRPGEAAVIDIAPAGTTGVADAGRDDQVHGVHSGRS